MNSLTRTTTTVNTSSSQFDPEMYQAALAYYGLPPGYTSIFNLVPITGKDGKPNTQMRTCKADEASKAGRAPWVQMNRSGKGRARNNYGPKKPLNMDIGAISNITLDFENPANPQIAHTIGQEMAAYLVADDLAAEGLPVEDSGAGCHIVLPLPAIAITPDTAERWNEAVRSLIERYISPEFKRLTEKAGASMKLEAFDISRLFSAPGTWRPTNPAKDDCEALQGGYLRRWLAPYINGAYPTRLESTHLAALLQEEYARLEAPPAQPSIKRHQAGQETAYQWLADHYRKYATDDRSAWFHALVCAVYLKFDADTVRNLGGSINSLSGEKYDERRLDKEITRSLKRAMEKPKDDRTPLAFTPPGTHGKKDRMNVVKLAAPNTLDEKEAAAPVKHKFTYASEVQPEPVDWLWKKRIARGMATLMVGDPGLGKSVTLIKIAAAVSTGGMLPDNGTIEPGGVVLMAPEDSDAHTIVPRLIAAGADLSKIILLSTVTEYGSDGKEYQRPISFPGDASILEEAIQDCQASLAIIDPVMSMIDMKYDSHKDQAVRAALGGVLAVAKANHCALVGVVHLNKGQSSNALYRSGGSIGFIGQFRIGLFVVPDPDNEQGGVIINHKNNIASQTSTPSLRYSFHETPQEIAYIEWEGASTYEPKYLLNQPTSTDNPKSEQETGLLAVLKKSTIAMTAMQVCAELDTGQSLDAVEKMLKRKVNQGVLMRPARGMYTYNGNPLYTATSHTQSSDGGCVGFVPFGNDVGCVPSNNGKMNGETDRNPDGETDILGPMSVSETPSQTAPSARLRETDKTAIKKTSVSMSESLSSSAEETVEPDVKPPDVRFMILKDDLDTCKIKEVNWPENAPYAPAGPVPTATALKWTYRLISSIDAPAYLDTIRRILDDLEGQAREVIEI